MSLPLREAHFCRSGRCRFFDSPHKRRGVRRGLRLNGAKLSRCGISREGPATAINSAKVLSSLVLPARGKDCGICGCVVVGGFLVCGAPGSSAFLAGTRNRWSVFGRSAGDVARKALSGGRAPEYAYCKASDRLLPPSWLLSQFLCIPTAIHFCRKAFASIADHELSLRHDAGGVSENKRRSVLLGVWKAVKNPA